MIRDFFEGPNGQVLPSKNFSMCSIGRPTYENFLEVKIPIEGPKRACFKKHVGRQAPIDHLKFVVPNSKGEPTH